MKSMTFLLSVAMIMELLLSASSGTAAMNPWNASTTDDAGELDGINWQVSLAGAGNIISFNTLQRPPICNEKIIGSCIGEKKPGQRPCNYYNYCGPRGG
ncbi:hypothetical protein RND71_019660 [Anisodus tanguticus]|uniref:Uncharacterized protein n=1 Tax=Anisodus tanguticus TaxID=243964 RepID=A0AAE1S0Y1_9SOLA|nr:hypothetical protein RND71_019660 [Anisodus tanguticus]